MTVNISFRHIAFTPTLTGVRIQAWTDVPCHLYCRLSLEHPWKHKKTSIVRGLPLMDDYYYCFTVYKDNEQFEGGDTLVHTWWKPDWPPCTTKYLYLWGYVSGVVSVSTSPIFEYHNTGEDPIPPPEEMQTFNAIEPQLISLTASNVWTTLDASLYVPDGATGLILHLHNRQPGQENYMGLRALGQTHNYFGAMWRESHTYAICPLDADRKWQYYARVAASQDIWVMGYTGRNVVFYDEPHDIMPSNVHVWEDVDIGSFSPNAKAVIVSMGAATLFPVSTDIRMKGGTDNRYISSYHIWPTIGLDVNGFCQIKTGFTNPLQCQAWAIGYIPSGITTLTDGLLQGGIPAATWFDVMVATLLPNPRWVIYEIYQSAGKEFGIQKGSSLRTLKERGHFKSWAYAHVRHANNTIRFYKTDAQVWFYKIAELP